MNIAGYRKNLRRLQKVYQVDPYSRNPALGEELKRIVSAQTATGFAFKFVPGFNICLIGKASRYITDAEEIALYETLEIVKKNNRDLYRK
ncbi:MAG: hypothetical protein IT292_08960 [Deltaproteobacteria bacterium]|nr:hypothetical protein [Deltaproteobacteria bacterium]